MNLVWLVFLLNIFLDDFLYAGIPSVIPTEMCYLGWQESLEKLIKLVEPEIPDG
jgi:hypothetical protein